MRSYPVLENTNANAKRVEYGYECNNFVFKFPSTKYIRYIALPGEGLAKKKEK